MPENILIVEDDLDLAVLIQFALRAHGFAATIAGNGREALEAVAEQMPDLIILDMMMPIMNGWEFADAFDRAYGRAAPILVLTAAENAKARAAEVGANGVLAKPFDTKKLVATVKDLLAHRIAAVGCRP